MENVWVLAALWVGLALVATLLAIWFHISTALTEIVVGTVAQLIIGAFLVHNRNWKISLQHFTEAKPFIVQDLTSAAALQNANQATRARLLRWILASEKRSGGEI